MTAVVTHFSGQIECWGIWNEPNLRGFFDGTEDQFVNQIFLPAAAAIRAADPSARICGPELAGLAASSNWNGKNGTCAFGSCMRNGWELDLGEMLTRVGSQIDVVTQHTYQSDAPGVMSALLDGDTVAGVLTHDSIRHVIDSHGGAAKEFWLTETGWEHGPQGSMADADVVLLPLPLRPGLGLGALGLERESAPRVHCAPGLGSGPDDDGVRMGCRAPRRRAASSRTRRGEAAG